MMKQEAKLKKMMIQYEHRIMMEQRHFPDNN